MFHVLNLSQPLDLVFWAACLVGFFSFLRKSNLLAGKGETVSHLCRKDIRFIPQGALLTVQHSKTVQYGERKFVVPIPRIKVSPLCPSSALKLAMSLGEGHPEAPALQFSTTRGVTPLSCQLFLDRLKSILSTLGVDASRYAGHSLRRGGASLALACNVPSELIKLQGGWASYCYQGYLDPDLDTKFSLASAMTKQVRDVNEPLTIK